MKKDVLVYVRGIQYLMDAPQDEPEEPEKKEEGNDNPLVIVSDGRKQDNKAQEENPFDEPVDIDISESSGTIVYSTVYDMMWNPENYVGKKIRITGYFALGEDQHGRQLFGCIVPDATACCSQGIEFVLKNDRNSFGIQRMTIQSRQGQNNAACLEFNLYQTQKQPFCLRQYLYQKEM